jgi:hypothetical protein
MELSEALVQSLVRGMEECARRSEVALGKSHLVRTIYLRGSPEAPLLICAAHCFDLE